MTRPCLRVATLSLCAVAAASSLFAGGAWVPPAGDGNLQLGYSRKHAASSWNLAGDHVDNGSQHDFRYAYLSGDVGLLETSLGSSSSPGWLDTNRCLRGQPCYFSRAVKKARLTPKTLMKVVAG